MQDWLLFESESNSIAVRLIDIHTIEATDFNLTIKLKNFIEKKDTNGNYIKTREIISFYENGVKMLKNLKIKNSHLFRTIND